MDENENKLLKQVFKQVVDNLGGFFKNFGPFGAFLNIMDLKVTKSRPLSMLIVGKTTLQYGPERKPWQAVFGLRAKGCLPLF